MSTSGPGSVVIAPDCTVQAMSDPEDRDWGMRTRAIHAGARPDPTTGARAVPIYQTTSFVFEDTAGRRRPVRAAEVREHLHAARATRPWPRSRSGSRRLEGGIGAVATGSGQAAETLLFTQLCDAGDHIVASVARCTAGRTRCST